MPSPLQAIVNSMGDSAMDILEAKPTDIIAKKTEALTKVKTELKGDAEVVKAAGANIDKLLAAFPETLDHTKRQVCRHLVQSLTGRAITLVQSIPIDDPRAMWLRLKQEFEGTGAANVMALYTLSASIRHESGTPLSLTIAKFDDIYRRMVDKKDTPSHNYRVGQLLASLPSEYAPMKAAMTAIDKEWTWQEAVDRLLAHQEQSAAPNLRRSKPIGEAYTASASKSACFNCGRSGHYIPDCNSPCVKCPPSIPSHIPKDCPRSARNRGRPESRGRKPIRRNQTRGMTAATAAAAGGKNESSWLFSTETFLHSSSTDTPLNILDSGCSTHMLSCDQDCIKKYSCKPVNVSTAADSVLRIAQKGVARIEFKNGLGERETATLSDALISPTL